MWEWDWQYDEMGVGYCISALESLATDFAIDNIKHIAMTSNISYQTMWMYPSTVSTLSRAGRLKDVIDLSIFYNEFGDSLLDALKNFETHKVIQEIDERLKKQEDKLESLVKLKDKLMSS